MNLSKDKVHRVLKKYQSECSKTQLKPSRLEVRANSIHQKLEALTRIDELKTQGEELEKRKLFTSLKTKGSPFVGNLIKRKVIKDFTKEPDFAEIREHTLGLWIRGGLDTMLQIYEISALELLDTFNQWYCLGTRIYPGTGRFATGEECLVLEIYDHMRNEMNLLRELDERERERSSVNGP